MRPIDAPTRLPSLSATVAGRGVSGTASAAIRVVLRWSQRPFRRVDCGKTARERHPEVARRRSLTNRLRRRLFERACEMPFVDVAASEGVSCYRVIEAFDWYSTTELVYLDAAPPRTVSLDESAFRKRSFQFRRLRDVLHA